MITIMVLRTDPNGIWREKLAGIAAFARIEGWRIQTIDARSSLPRLGSLIKFWNPAGIIIDASGDTRSLDLGIFSRLPCVCMTPSSDKVRQAFPSVCSSPSDIAAIAARELLQREIRTLALIDAPDSPYWARSKREAFKRIAELHGFKLNVVKANAIPSLKRPIGLFAVTDGLAADALSIAERAGMRIPEDLSVVGVDDNPEICENCEPTLSSVRPNFHLLGFTAAKILKKHMRFAYRKLKSQELPPVGLVRRASSSIHTDPQVSLALERIRMKACEGLAVTDVAELFGNCSRRSVELRFKAATGKTITESILEVRLEHACNYLKEGNVSVAAMANFCGWNSDLSFRKAFKKRFGRPPSDSRRKMQLPIVPRKST